MSQPYIFKKQLISLALFLLLLIFLLLFHKDSVFVMPVLFYCFQVISITFVPSLRRKIEYPLFLHTIFYYSSMLLPLFFVDIYISEPRDIVGVTIGMTSSLFMLLSNIKHNRKYVSTENYMVLSGIDIREFMYQNYNNIYAVVSEELFYRYFLIGYLYKYIGIYAVLLSTLLFVYSHYINRWANLSFTLKSYIYHGLCGLIFGLLFFYTRSLFGCIIAHILFNSPEFIVTYKRYINNKKEMNPLFDDYDQ